MPIVGQFGSLAGLGSLILPGGAMESIATVTVGSGGSSSISFSSIPGDYQHLQIRMLGLLSSSQQGVWVRFNSDTATNYSAHLLYGNGTSALAASRLSDGGMDAILPYGANQVFAGIVDILDYTSTSKYKTIRTFSGADNNGSGIVGVTSGSWRNTAAVTAIHLSDQLAGGTFGQYTTAALYGVRA